MRSELDRRLLLKTGLALVAGPVWSAFPKEALYDFTFVRVMYESGDWDVDQRMPTNLIQSLIEYTQINPDPKEKVIALSDPRLLDYPFCYLAGHKLVQFNEAESRNFVDYIQAGGLMFVDDCNHDIDGWFAKSFESEVSRLLGPDALQKLPNHHDLYRIFFKLDGPPTTSMELNGWGDDLVHDYLKGVLVDGQLNLIYSNKDYGCEWDYDWRNKRWLAVDNTRLGVNLILYALTR